MRGMTLVELLIALGISSVLMIVGFTLHLGSINAYKYTEDFTSLSQDSFLVVQWLRGFAMGAGGGTMQAWMGIGVEDNCAALNGLPACQSSDRLTVTTISVPEQTCTVTGMVGAVTKGLPVTVNFATTPATTCCLSPTTGQSSFAGRQIMLVNSGYFAQRFVNSVDLGKCQLTYQDGQAVRFDSTPFQTDWTGGTASLVNVETLYWDPAANTLNGFVDADGDGVRSAAETTVLVDQIYDFQVALGYDFSPPDGKVTQTANGANDEWLYNAAAEKIGTGLFTGTFSTADLMLIEIGVLIGAPKPNAVYAGTTPLLNGPAKTINGVNLRPVITRMAPRNTTLFQ